MTLRLKGTSLKLGGGEVSVNSGIDFHHGAHHVFRTEPDVPKPVIKLTTKNTPEIFGDHVNMELYLYDFDFDSKRVGGVYIMSDFLRNAGYTEPVELKSASVQDPNVGVDPAGASIKLWMDTEIPQVYKDITAHTIVIWLSDVNPDTGDKKLWIGGYNSAGDWGASINPEWWNQSNADPATISYMDATLEELPLDGLDFIVTEKGPALSVEVMGDMSVPDDSDEPAGAFVKVTNLSTTDPSDTGDNFEFYGTSAASEIFSKIHSNHLFALDLKNKNVTSEAVMLEVDPAGKEIRTPHFTPYRKSTSFDWMVQIPQLQAGESKLFKLYLTNVQGVPDVPSLKCNLVTDIYKLEVQQVHTTLNVPYHVNKTAGDMIVTSMIVDSENSKLTVMVKNNGDQPTGYWNGLDYHAMVTESGEQISRFFIPREESQVKIGNDTGSWGDWHECRSMRPNEEREYVFDYLVPTSLGTVNFYYQLNVDNDYMQELDWSNNKGPVVSITGNLAPPVAPSLEIPTSVDQPVEAGLTHWSTNQTTVSLASDVDGVYYKINRRKVTLPVPSEWWQDYAFMSSSFKVGNVLKQIKLTSGILHFKIWKPTNDATLAATGLDQFPGTGEEQTNRLASCNARRIGVLISEEEMWFDMPEEDNKWVDVYLNTGLSAGDYTGIVMWFGGWWAGLENPQREYGLRLIEEVNAVPEGSTAAVPVNTHVWDATYWDPLDYGGRPRGRARKSRVPPSRSSTRKAEQR